MTIKLIRVGNSMGIRLPKKVIEQFNFTDEIDAEIKKEGLLLKKKKVPRNPRTGWENRILREIEKGGYPEMLIPDNIENEFDESEWQW